MARGSWAGGEDATCGYHFQRRPQAARALVTYVPLTTQNRGSPYEIGVGNVRFLNEASVANVQGIGSIPVIRLQRKLGSLPTDTLDKIKQALRSAFDL